MIRLAGTRAFRVAAAAFVLASLSTAAVAFAYAICSERVQRPYAAPLERLRPGLPAAEASAILERHCVAIGDRGDERTYECRPVATGFCCRVPLRIHLVHVVLTEQRLAAIRIDDAPGLALPAVEPRRPPPSRPPAGGGHAAPPAARGERGIAITAVSEPAC